MLWPMTVLGALAGGLLGDIPGGLLGAVLGHALDRHWGLRRWSDLASRFNRSGPAFEEVLFLCLGRLAKAEGRVEPVHLQLARDIMQQYRLDDAARLKAMRDFNRGKDPSVRVAARLKRLFRSQPARAAEVIDSCWRMALVSGSLGPASRQLLDQWSALAGLGKAEHQRMHQRHHRSRAAPSPPMASRDLLREAASVLDVDLNASPESIKRAYRRQLSKHHPDKMRNASPAMLAQAGERIRAIQEAYERVRRHRGFR